MITDGAVSKYVEYSPAYAAYQHVPHPAGQCEHDSLGLVGSLTGGLSGRLAGRQADSLAGRLAG